VLDWCADDQPFALNVPGMLAVPYAIALNVINLLISRGFTGEDFRQAVVDQFDRLYADSSQSGLTRVLCESDKEEATSSSSGAGGNAAEREVSPDEPCVRDSHVCYIFCASSSPGDAAARTARATSVRLLSGRKTMTRRSKVSSMALLAVVLAVGTLAFALSHTSACGVAPAVPAGVASMRAATYRCYGSPDVVKIETLAKPTLGDHVLLVRVHAASLNALEYHFMRGEPYVVRAMTGLGAPKDVRLGTDYAGTVEAVGKLVTRFNPGDEVFGGGSGALAQYITVWDRGPVALKPANVTFEQAAAVPVAAVTALHALRNGKIQSGQKVLVNGAGGGVGTYSVELAKAFGAEVTAVTSTGNLDLVRSIGADHVIDYTREDFTAGAGRYDLIIDCGGGHSLTAYRRALTPTGIYLEVGEVNMGKWVEPFMGAVTQPVMSALGKQQFRGLFANPLSTEDITAMRDLLQSGKLNPVIDRRYPLEQTSVALRYLETGKVRGKLIVTID
jgi:NADPH:quinone reductase-like Zn-dependent oxidoreductase